MVCSNPHYDLVPKDFKANLSWREQIISDCNNDADFAAAIWDMCSEDMLFYFNGFLWTYDPRDSKMPNKPFITYKEFQDKAIMDYLHSFDPIDPHDTAWPKSRTMGATWMALGVIEHEWHFSPEPLSFGLVSRNEDCVDCRGDPMSLMWKIDYFHRFQPDWLLPTGRQLGWGDPNRKLLHVGNADTLATIDGQSTTGDVFRSGRLTGLFMDELAAFEVKDGFNAVTATRDVTRSRMYCSTPKGASNAFFEVVHNSTARVTHLHWSSHPEYNKGLYICEPDGSLKLLDDFQGMVKVMRKGWKEPQWCMFPEDYPFILEKKEIEKRSPWYDNECARCVTKQEVNQELNIDFLGSDYQFFDNAFIMGLIKQHCSPPIFVGDLVFDKSTLEVEGVKENPKGALKLWLSIGGSGELLDDFSCLEGRRFGIGSDVSHGTGASNSATSIVDMNTGEKVGLWIDPYTDPKDFADVTLAIAGMFNKGTMIWDASGAAGKSFTKEVMKNNYANIYYRRNEGHVRERISDQPGYFLNPEDRAVLLRDYRNDLESKSFINRSESGLRETLQFVVQPGGKVEHSKSLSSQDPTGAREAHGDEVIADALVSRLISIEPSSLEQQKPEAPWMSPQWRFEQEENAALVSDMEDW